MVSTYGCLRRRLALRSASARLAAHSAWLQAAMPLGQSLLGGCAAKGVRTVALCFWCPCSKRGRPAVMGLICRFAAGPG
jgi:hypothetical protein